MKLAIVGAEEHTRDLAPWDDLSYDIWLFNEWATENWCKRYTATLDIHWSQIYTDPQYDRGTGYWQWLQQSRGKPVYMQAVDPDIPDSVRYPLKEINREFLSTLTFESRPVKNLRTTTSYAIALGLYQNYEAIDIYGVELDGNEYKGQKSNFAFWVGVATGRKVPVNLHCSRGTFDHALYGYEAFSRSVKSQDYILGITNQLKEEENKVAMLQGALQLANQMLEQEQKDDNENVV